MARCLLIEDRNKIAALYALNMRVYVGVDVIQKKTLEDAIKLLEVVPEIDLIVVRASIEEEQTAKKVFEYVETLALPIPIVVIGNEKSLEGHVKMLDAAIDVNYLVPAVAKILGVTARDMASQVMPLYYKIPLKYLIHMQYCTCDIYIQILRKNSTPQYIKLINKNETAGFAKKAIKKYRDKGIKELYILSMLRIAFVKCFTRQIIDKIHTEDLAIEERIRVTEVSQEFVGQEIFEGKLSNEVISVAEAGVYSMIRLTEKAGHQELRNILMAFMQEKSSLRYMLAQLITYLACHAIAKMEWGTKEQQQKIGYVAFFHDILLRSDKLATIFSDEELEKADLSKEEKNLVKNHAVWTLEYLNDYPEVEFGANILIKQHHGSQSGVGFAKNFSSMLSPLAITFIASEHYAREVLKLQQKGSKVQHQEVVAKLDEHLLEKVKYRRVVESFEELFQK